MSVSYNVITSEKRNYVWFRNPRVASRSIAKVLGVFSDADITNQVNHVDYYDKFMNRQVCYDASWNNLFKFVFVRNPWSRIVSFYWEMAQYAPISPRKTTGYMNHLKQKFKQLGMNDRQIKDFLREYTFEQFVYELGYNNLTDCNRHYRRQLTLFPRHRVDFIGKFENIDHDIGIVMEKIGVDDYDFSWTGKSAFDDYTTFYTNESRMIVAKLYEEDIDTFNYKFGD